MSVIEFFAKGGPVMYLLLLASIYVLAVILYKSWQFYQFRLMDHGFITKMLDAWQQGQKGQALTLATGAKHPLGHVLAECIRLSYHPALPEDKRDMRIETLGNQQLSRLESHLKSLEMLANISPLLGLLGTVTGIVKAFSHIEATGSRVDPAILAGGIWEALLTTVAGLVIAIAALAAHHCLERMVDRQREALQYAVVHLSTE